MAATYYATFGGPTDINNSLQAQQGLSVGPGEQREVHMACKICRAGGDPDSQPTETTVTWAFWAYPLGGSLSDASLKAANTKTAREIKDHMRKAHPTNPDVRAAVPRGVASQTQPGSKSKVTPVTRSCASVGESTPSSTVTAPVGSNGPVVAVATAAVTVKPERHSPANDHVLMSPPGPAFGLTHDHGKVQLPCMIEQKFRHPVFGNVRVQAELLWSDVTLPEPVSAASNAELFHSGADDIPLVTPDPGHDETLFPGCKGFLWPTRMCFFHQIRAVEPRETPLALYVGEMFSSFFASTQNLQAGGGGFGNWHLLNQPKWTMARVLSERGFFNVNLDATPHARLLNGFQVLRTSQERQRARVDKNMLQTGSLALISKAAFSAQFGNVFTAESDDSQGAAVDGSSEPDSDTEPSRKLPTVFTQQADVKGDWLRMVPVWMEALTGVPGGASVKPPQSYDLQRYVARHAQLARQIRNCHMGDIHFRDALALNCKFECNEMECELHRETQASGLAGFQCKHGVHHKVLPRDTDAQENLLEDAVHGHVDDLPPNDGLEAGEGDAEDVTMGDGEGRRSSGRGQKRKAANYGDDVQPKKRAKQLRKLPTENFRPFDPRNASPYESCIRLQRYNHVKYLPHCRPWVEKALNFVLWVLRMQFFSYFKGYDTLPSPLRERVSVGAFDVLLSTATGNRELWGKQRRVRDVSELAALERYWRHDRRAPHFIYHPVPLWQSTTWVLRDKGCLLANAQRCGLDDRIHLEVSQEVHRRLFPENYE